ncbi:trypsin-like peptidase domain-containing protein [Candidatus Babeliales bacterium]|nr:trypsin-like peptidase domain-containing protein [Candidatus Babeliales bacterium]
MSMFMIVRRLLACSLFLALGFPNVIVGKRRHATPTGQAVPAVENFEHKSPVRAHHNWSSICRAYGNAVLRITVCHNVMNIMEPYKIPDQSFSCGTGFVISGDGYVLTNFHVVNQGNPLYAQVPALGREYFELEFVGANPEKDVALVKIVDRDLEKIKKALGVEQLTYFSCGDSDGLAEAQEVLILGYPLGQENLKSSLGIISGRESTSVGECLQTTAPINPGNSGGPSLDENGNVVGICVLKAVGADTEGVAYLIPINNVRAMLAELIKNKITRPPCWGCKLTPVNEHTLKFLGNPTDGGVYVAKVSKGSLAQQAGLQKGDIVYAVNGTVIDRYGQLNVSWTRDKVSLRDFMARIELGSTATLTYYRNGKLLETSVVVAGTDSFAIKRYYPWYEDALPYEVLGAMVFVTLTLNHIDIFREIARYYPDFDMSMITKYEREEKRFEPRLIMTALLPTSSLHKTRCFREGDRIVSKINGVTVHTVQDLREAIIAGKGSEYLTIECEGGSFFCLLVRDIIQEEDILCQQYGYKKSELVHLLAEGLN